MELYRAVDEMDGEVSLFVVAGEEMFVSTDTGQGDSWLYKDRFVAEEFLPEPLDWSRMRDPQKVW